MASNRHILIMLNLKILNRYRNFLIQELFGFFQNRERDTYAICNPFNALCIFTSPTLVHHYSIQSDVSRSVSNHSSAATGFVSSRWSSHFSWKLEILVKWSTRNYLLNSANTAFFIPNFGAFILVNNSNWQYPCSNNTSIPLICCFITFINVVSSLE
eukprot:NODE_524_length_7257_cov_0.465912.p3 type:complete len:157 gc:universal NODE_524_length_7257_cov_0.465912:5627-5157(-)